MILSQQISLFSYFFFLCFLEKIDAVIIHSGSKSFVKNYKHLDPDFTIHKVSLTQKGYIQFLRYITKVPTLTDYTFCIWVRSDNLTYNHPLLSYSKHEEERLIRVWISPKGKYLCLEIMGHPIFMEPVNMVENHWYHICQSWSSHQAAWELFLNGKLKSSGFVPKLQGIPIKGDGDIVVGQEYTDFDKGLDDGIEGDVFGFNFVLSSTSTSSKHTINPIKLANYPLRRQFDGRRHKPQLYAANSLNMYHPLPPEQFNFEPTTRHLIAVNDNRDFLNSNEEFSETTTEVDVPSALGYFNVQPNRHPKGLMELGRDIFGMFNFFEPEVRNVRLPVYHKLPPVHNHQFSERRILSNAIDDSPKSLGLLLVELTLDCGFKKGAPLSGKGVLINWTKSPVRVFGGAILKSAPPFCRKADAFLKSIADGYYSYYLLKINFLCSFTLLAILLPLWPI